MASDIEQNVREEIRQLLKKINSVWVECRLEELEEYFHHDMVIVSPEFRERGKGKHTCIESYKEFTNNAAIREFKSSDPAIDV
ncbi:MAG: hypothetical protein U9O90_00835 [Euryarchaeota archaeon]|nr:hypothetical protein [Euryarchaeota archaeon]